MSASTWLACVGAIITICAGSPNPGFAQRGHSKKPAKQPKTQKPRPGLPVGTTAKTIKLPDGSERKYAIFVPPQYNLDTSHKWPVILFLHGSGQCGRDGIKQTQIGLVRYISKRPDRFPFIVIYPQAHTLWFRGDDAVAVWTILDSVLEEYRTDPDRVYLTGLSMGGFATWEYAVARPDVFAAIIPICGSGPLEYIANIQHLPTWAFHGAKDKNVPVQSTRRLIAELRRLGAKPKYNEFPGLGHNSWDRAYNTPHLWEWLLKQRRDANPSVIDHRFPEGSIKLWWLAARADPAAKTPAHIRVEVHDDGRVSIESTNVLGWALSSGPEPLQPGKSVDVTWNGKLVYRGVFEGLLGASPQAASQPSQ